MSFHEDIQAYHRLVNPPKPKNLPEAILQMAKDKCFVSASVIRKPSGLAAVVSVTLEKILSEDFTQTTLIEALDKLLLIESNLSYTYQTCERSATIIFSFVYQSIRTDFRTF